jgi:hypothetical protein
LSSNEGRKKERLLALLIIKDMGRVPKRLKTDNEPVVEAVEVKEEKEEEEESLDNDENEEEEDDEQEGQVAEPVPRTVQPRYKPQTTKTKVHPDGLQ